MSNFLSSKGEVAIWFSFADLCLTSVFSHRHITLFLEIQEARLKKSTLPREVSNGGPSITAEFSLPSLGTIDFQGRTLTRPLYYKVTQTKF